MKTEHLILLIVIIAILIAAGLTLYWFISLSTVKQKEKVKEWLIGACIEAERRLQSGTGQLKLREAYNMFCSVPAFTWVARIVSFATFSIWVSESLKIAKEMLVRNKSLAEHVYGENAAGEVDKLKKQLEDGS